MPSIARNTTNESRGGGGGRRRFGPRMAALAAWALVLLGGAAFAQPRVQAADPGRDFAMTVYQGQRQLGGEHVNFASLLGRGKPLVLNFWAALCPPCRAEMPGFERVYHDLGSRVTFVGVDLGSFTGLGSHDDARTFLRVHGITYPAAYATSAAPLQAYRILGMPTTIIFDGTGKVAATHTGYLDEARLRRLLQGVLTGDGAVSSGTPSPPRP